MREIQRIAQDPLSLDSPVGEEDDSNLGRLHRGPARPTRPPTWPPARMLTEAVEEALGELNDREQEVVRLRFGLDDGQVRTLEEVGKEFGVTRERIRQIESKTLAKLRHPQRSQKLEGVPGQRVTGAAGRRRPLLSSAAPFRGSSVGRAADC